MRWCSTCTSRPATSTICSRRTTGKRRRSCSPTTACRARLWAYEDLARVHLSLSGSLLETLSHPDFQRKVYGIVDCGTLLWALQNTKIFEILGTGYYHPVLALIPEADWDEQIARWQALARHVFWRSHFPGFWPPELGFDERLIPHLKKAGYRYVIVDSEYVDPVGEMSWQELRYRPHVCAYGGRGDRRRRARPRPFERAARRHGARLVHQRTQRAHQVVRFPAASRHRHRRRQRRLVPQRQPARQLLELLLPEGAGRGSRRQLADAADLHQRLPRSLRRARPRDSAPRRLEHRRAPRLGLPSVAGQPDAARRPRPHLPPLR